MIIGLIFTCQVLMIISTLCHALMRINGLLFIGGGNTESEFRNAPNGSRKNIWMHQVSQDPKYFPHRDKVYSNFLQDPKGVMYAPHDLIVHHMDLDKTACRLHVKAVGH